MTRDDGDPPRLGAPGADAPAALTTLLDAARADVGTGAEVEALRAALAGSLWPGGAPDAGVTAPQVGAGAAGGATASAAGLAVKATLATLVVGGAVVFATTRVEPKASAPQAGPVVVTGAPRSPEPGRAPDEPSPEPAPAPPPSAVPGPQPASAPQPSPASRPPDASPRAAITPSEAALLGEAQAALARHPALALSLAEQHRTRYPRGMLAQEREVIAIEALERTGRAAAAATRARRFFAAYPSSAHRSKVESLISKK